MKIQALAFGIAAALCVPVVGAADSKHDKQDRPKTGVTLSNPDQMVITTVHAANQHDLEVAKLAKKHGHSDAVKAYGDKVVTEQERSDQELVAFAKSRGIAKVPQFKPVTDSDKRAHKDNKAAIAELKRLRGADFDKAFLTMAITQKEKAIADTDTLMINDPDLKAIVVDNRKAMLQAQADELRDLQQSQPQARVAPPKKR